MNILKIVKKDLKLIFTELLEKYGTNFITTEKLDECLTEKEAKFKEVYYIDYYSTYKNGYNMTPGGSGGNTKSKYSKSQMKKWSENRRQLSSGMNNGNAKPNVNKDDIIEQICNFVIQKNMVRKNILRKEIDQILKETMNISSTMLKNRGIKNHSELIVLVNEKLGIENSIIYDPYYRSPMQKQNLSLLSSNWVWVTNGLRNLRIKKQELTIFLQNNNEYRQGRTL